MIGKKRQPLRRLSKEEKDGKIGPYTRKEDGSFEREGMSQRPSRHEVED